MLCSALLSEHSHFFLFPKSQIAHFRMAVLAPRPRAMIPTRPTTIARAPVFTLELIARRSIVRRKTTSKRNAFSTALTYSGQLVSGSRWCYAMDTSNVAKTRADAFAFCTTTQGLDALAVYNSVAEKNAVQSAGKWLSKINKAFSVDNWSIRRRHGQFLGHGQLTNAGRHGHLDRYERHKHRRRVDAH